MKFYLLPKAAIRDTDTASMREDIAFLLEQGVDVRRPAKSRCQLKLDETTNYYPGKGTLFVDGDAHACRTRALWQRGRHCRFRHERISSDLLERCSSYRAWLGTSGRRHRRPRCR